MHLSNSQALQINDHLPTALALPAGLGAIQPEQGLAVLLAALYGNAGSAVVTASPLYWGNLLQQQPQQAGSVFASFSALAHAPAHAAPAWAGPVAAAAPAVDRAAEVQARILGIAAEVIGAAIDPTQSLMEVSMQRMMIWGWAGRGNLVACFCFAFLSWLAVVY